MKTLVAVEGQTLRWYGKIPEIADNSVQFVQLEFSLPEDWVDLVVVAQFSQTKTYNKLLENGCCYLPAELVAGPCEVSLFGQKAGDTVRATSVPLRFKISRSGFTSTAETPIPPTPDLYAQLLEKLGHQDPSEGVSVGDDGEGNVSFAPGFEGDGEEHELNSLNTGKTVYTSFLDKVAREGLKGKLANPGGLTPGKLLRVKSVDQNGNILLEGVDMPSEGSSVVIDTTLTQPGQAADAKATGDAISKLSGQNVAQVEPMEDDIPILYFGGPLAQTKDDVVMPFEYRSKTASYKGYVKTKAAGNSSMAFPKKNQNVKFYKDSACEEKLKISFKGWPKTHKFRLNANWIDITHARNIVTCRLWADTVRSRPDFDQLPELLQTSPNLGTIDGFPILVYADGVYQGRYTLNIPKDAYMASMDDELAEHCILYSENYDSGWFRNYANIDGTDWSDEVHDVVPDSIRTRWNEVIAFVMNSSDDEFHANLHQYFDVTSLIDYLCLGLASNDYDGFGKNQQYLTYDGQLFYANYYDKDATWLLSYTGQGFLPSNYLDYLREDSNLLYWRLVNTFIPEIQARWTFLRNGPLAFANLDYQFERFIRICPPHVVAEDYAETTGGGAFTEIPSKATNNIQQIRVAVKARLAFCDDYIANLEPFVSVPCTGITLDNVNLSFDALTTQTLTATIMPEGCTEAVVWESDNEEVATIKNGVVTPVGNGSATVTVRCGAQSATCTITVSGVTGNIMSGVTWSLGFIQDGGTIGAATNTVVTPPFDVAEYVGQSVIVDYSIYVDYAQRQACYDATEKLILAPPELIQKKPREYRDIPATAATMCVMMTNKAGASVALKTAVTEDIGFSGLEQHNGNLDYNTGELGAQQYMATTVYVPVTPGEEYKVSQMFGGCTFDAEMNYVGNANLKTGTALFECPEGVAFLGVTGNNAARTMERIVSTTTIGSSTFVGL